MAHPLPGGFLRHVDGLEAGIADAGAEDRQNTRLAFSNIEGGMDHAGGNEDRIAGFEQLLPAIDPLLDLTCDNEERFLLVRVLVEIMALAGQEPRLEDGELLGAGIGRHAQIADAAPIMGCKIHPRHRQKLAVHSLTPIQSRCTVPEFRRVRS